MCQGNTGPLQCWSEICGVYYVLAYPHLEKEGQLADALSWGHGVIRYDVQDVAALYSGMDMRQNAFGGVVAGLSIVAVCWCF
jgi:hypothetical protein